MESSYLGVHTESVSWHEKLGHPNQDMLQVWLENQKIKGKHVPDFCEACVEAKHAKQPFKNVGRRASTPLEVVHSDIIGPINTASIKGAKYIITFVDDYSRYTLVYPVREKSQLLDCFKEYKAKVEHTSKRKISCVRSDQGKEYMSKEFKSFLNDNSIHHETSSTYTPQQNGLAERANRTLINTARSLLISARLPERLWGEAVNTAAFLRNLVPKTSLSNESPEFRFYQRSTPKNYIKRIGCICFVKKPGQKGKMEAVSTKAVMLGYEQEKRAWRAFIPSENKIIVSREILFNEAEMYYKNTKASVSSDATYYRLFNLSERYDDEAIGDRSEQINTETLSVTESNVIENMATQENLINQQTIESPLQQNQAQVVQVETSTLSTTDQVVRPKLGPPQRRSTRIQELRNQLEAAKRDRMTLESERAAIARSDAFCLSASIPQKEPKTLNEALNCSEKDSWVKAMSEELKSLDEMKVWTLTTLPAGRRAIGCRWVFKLKLNVDGSVNKYKARLVAQGYNQREGLDYSETFAPVCRAETIRLLLTLAAKYNYEVHQLDVKTAYLYGLLKEDIYMLQPPGFVDSEKGDLVCKLKKSLYGLKQSGREWHTHLKNTLSHIGFICCISDNSVFFKLDDDGNYIFVLTYVDDLLITAASPNVVHGIKEHLAAAYEITDLGEVKYFLGIECSREKSRVTFS